MCEVQKNCKPLFQNSKDLRVKFCLTKYCLQVKRNYTTQIYLLYFKTYVIIKSQVLLNKILFAVFVICAIYSIKLVSDLIRYGPYKSSYLYYFSLILTYFQQTLRDYNNYIFTLNLIYYHPPFHHLYSNSPININNNL